jgi:hypothetical protein
MGTVIGDGFNGSSGHISKYTNGRAKGTGGKAKGSRPPQQPPACLNRGVGPDLVKRSANPAPNSESNPISGGQIAALALNRCARSDLHNIEAELIIVALYLGFPRIILSYEKDSARTRAHLLLRITLRGAGAGRRGGPSPPPPPPPSSLPALPGQPVSG